MNKWIRFLVSAKNVQISPNNVRESRSQDPDLLELWHGVHRMECSMIHDISLNFKCIITGDAYNCASLVGPRLVRTLHSMELLTSHVWQL